MGESEGVTARLCSLFRRWEFRCVGCSLIVVLSFSWVARASHYFRGVLGCVLSAEVRVSLSKSVNMVYVLCIILVMVYAEVVARQSWAGR